MVILLLFLLAAPCEQATQLVIQAYDLGDRSNVYARKKALLQQALNLCPDHADAHNNLGVILENEQLYAQALLYYRRALHIDPKFWESWAGVGDVYFKQGQLPLSLEAYSHACTHEYAWKQVIFLLENGRFRTVEAGSIFKKESLSLLYDEPRLRQIRTRVLNCYDD